MKYQKILSYDECRVCTRIDTFQGVLTYRQLMKIQLLYIMDFTDNNVLEGIDKFQIEATIRYIIKWNEKAIDKFNN